MEPVLHDDRLPMGRHAVHLSPGRGTARRGGARRGEPVVLTGRLTRRYVTMEVNGLKAETERQAPHARAAAAYWAAALP